MGLAVALMPGKIHPVPGLPRAMLFVISHMFLVTGAIYVAVTTKYLIKVKHVIYILLAGNGAAVVIYFINKIMSTNFLYLMEAPKGTVIEKLDMVFGYPGYIFIMDLIAILIIASVFTLYKIFTLKSVLS